ncbi:DUF1329 domain-containing protein [Massilia dura]|uniref:DUF1329 domain-containing protein n=1 Tax=Pseudoduganella dura TaxID=321982 RepID=A0A6I3XBX7_9BURK|nr:DUF1329 domain-containing protein [Pseudoduganella dura]MUI11001.1 DUF1329 domain-containing protein [Pseudoduganella dura]GGY18439.1 hypothetical protein GCM10007386_54930 [Pseudoduganella dura]
MTPKHHLAATFAAFAGTLAFAGAVHAVTAEEAAQLGKNLTPLGAEKAGNKDGTIPAWDGGIAKAAAGFTNGGRRDQDPFAAEKPVVSITAKNMEQYADKLSDGSKAMLKKYPSYRIDVYPTHRTAAAPDWVYANTAKNATRAKLGDRLMPEGAHAGIPFPIPKSGAEVMWNHLLRWRGTDWQKPFRSYLTTAAGKPVMTVDGTADGSMPYYYKDAAPEKSGGTYWTIRLVNSGPPIRAGEAINGKLNLDPEKDASYVYLPGQRRTRKLPNACCDTPTPATAGVMSFDEVDIFGGRLDRFDWKILGKKEIYIPYNTNRSLKGKDADLLQANHLNPDGVRWELHRVWVVEAKLKSGQRHLAPRSVYYIDEDSWTGALADRWDANGQLWKTLWSLPVTMPDLPATTSVTFGFYDLVSGTWFVSDLVTEKAVQYKQVPRWPEATWSQEALSGSGLR